MITKTYNLKMHISEVQGTQGVDEKKLRVLSKRVLSYKSNNDAISDSKSHVFI